MSRRASAHPADMATTFKPSTEALPISSRMVDLWRRILCCGASGAALGALDALQSWLGAYLSSENVADLLGVLLLNTLALAWLGGLSAVLFALIEFLWGAVDRRLPTRMPMDAHAALLAVLSGLVTLTYLLIFGPQWGLDPAGAGGFFRPVTSGLLVWLGASALAPPATYVVLHWLGSRATRWAVHAALSLALYAQLTIFMQPIAHASPVDFLHLVVLVSLIALLQQFGMSIGCCSRRRAWAQGRAWAAVWAALLVPPMLIALALRAETQRVRLDLFERTALGFHVTWPLAPGFTAPACDFAQTQRKAPPASSLQPASPALSMERAARGVVLFVVDTLRADRLEGGRWGRALMPHMAALSRRAWSFERAYSAYASTPVSMQTLLSGAWLAPDRGSKNISTSLSLAALLRQHDVLTLAVPSHPNLDRNMPDFDRVDRRVEKLPDLRAVLTAPRVAAAVDALLATIQPKQRFFLFVHLYDPHGYYVPNPLFDFGRGAVERYDAEVAFTDHWLQQMMNRIAAQVGGKNLAFIVTADHGEEFDDHRYANHGHRLYEETLRVPLVVSAPGIGARRVARPVGAIDVAPTILNLLGLEAPPSLPGRSLLAVETPPVRPVFAWIGTKRAVITERDKLIWDKSLGLVELYDLRSDPAERHNLADLRPDRVDELYCLRRQHLKALSLAPPPPAPRPPLRPDLPRR